MCSFVCLFLSRCVNHKDYRAADDIQDTDKVRSLLKDLKEARQAKSREGLDQLNRGELSVRS